jgi:hypothetical protein
MADSMPRRLATDEPDHRRASSDPRDRRAHERIESGMSTICRVPASPHRATVIDVSKTGCRIRISDGLYVPVGSTVHMEFGPGRKVTGMVMWTEPRSAGVRFARPLSGTMAALLGVEPAALVEVEDASPPEPVGPAKLIPHWLRRLIKRAA